MLFSFCNIKSIEEETYFCLVSGDDDAFVIGGQFCCCAYCAVSNVSNQKGQVEK